MFGKIFQELGPAFTVLEWINTGIILCAIGALALPMLYTLALLIPQKKYKKAEVSHRFAVIICARNEEITIANLIDSIKVQDYPADKIDIIVVAHNCTDKTAEIAHSMDAKVIEVETTGKKSRKGYALHEAVKQLMASDTHEAYIVMDADNIMSRTFVSKMNDAFDSGVQIGVGFRNSKNTDDNCIAASNYITLLRDCRINAHARTRLRGCVGLGGTGFYVSRQIFEQTGGWNAFNIVEDLEFSMHALKKNNKNVGRYVAQAEYFDEQPHNLSSSLRRQTRIGKGVFQLFFKYSPFLLFRFFTRFRVYYLDFFLYFLYGPVAVLATLWFPFFYIYKTVMIGVHISTAAMSSFLINDILLQVVLYVLVPITIQNIIVLILERKRSTLKNPLNIIITMLIYPFYNLLCAAAITLGVLNPKLKWKTIKHDRPISLEEIEQQLDRRPQPQQDDAKPPQNK